MKILHVVADLMKASGISVFCCEVAAASAAQHHDVRIYVGQRLPMEYPLAPTLLRVETLKEVEEWQPDIVHIHGMWLPFFWKTFRWAKRHHLRVVWSAHGCLTPWSLRYKWLKKRFVWWLYQRRALQHVDLLHTTTPLETEDLRTLGLTRPVIEAPLGIHPPSTCPQKTPSPSAQKTALFLSFIHRVKGLIDLIDAWAALEPEDWALVIAGDCNDNYLDEVKAYAHAKRLHILFTGAVFGERKEELLKDADLFLLPSYSENFGVVVLEALAHGTPVLATTATPWACLAQEGCGWCISPGREALQSTLQTIFTTIEPSTLHAMGQRGHLFVKEHYNWSAIASTLLKGYFKGSQALPSPDALV